MAYKAKVPSSPRLYTKKYSSFRGVDFASDPTQIDQSRSPYAPNLISDTGGFPEKRCGWDVLLTQSGRMNGYFFLEYDNLKFYFAHIGTKLGMVKYSKPFVFTLLKDGLHDDRSVSFTFDKRLWILTGGEYLVVSIVGGAPQVRSVEEIAYIPTTSISRNPDGSGAVAFEGVNLLQPQLINSFVSDGSSRNYNLEFDKIDNLPVTVTVNSVAKPESEYIVNHFIGQVVFHNPPPAPAVIGQDNVVITYSKTVAGNKEKIKKSTVVTMFGSGGDQRLFFSGNKEYKNYDWYSGFDDPSYVPAENYSRVGSEQSAVMGYLRVGNQLAIIKSESAEDSSVFLRSVAKDSDGESLFPMAAGINGIGAVSKHMITSLRDDPLFLSKNGVFGIASTAISQERTLQNRSRRVDPMLTREGRMSQYVGVEWGNYLVMCNGISCYVADARRKTETVTGFEYEWYHWHNIPARIFSVIDGILYFGTDDGRLCYFKSEFRDNSRYNDNGAPIECYWSTKVDDDGDFLLRKSLVKDGVGLLIKPYENSGAEVLIRTEEEVTRLVGEYKPAPKAKLLDEGSPIYLDSPLVLNFTYRGRGHLLSQLIVKNDKLNQGLGIYEIVKRYVVSADTP